MMMMMMMMLMMMMMMTMTMMMMMLKIMLMMTPLRASTSTAHLLHELGSTSKCEARRTSHVTRHTSHVTRHSSHVTPHASPDKARKQPAPAEQLVCTGNYCDGCHHQSLLPSSSQSSSQSQTKRSKPACVVGACSQSFPKSYHFFYVLRDVL